MKGKCYLWINLSILFLTKEWIISGEKCFFQTTPNDMRRYPTVTDVLKMALSLPHRNADVERGLSINNSIVTKGPKI